MLEVPTTDVHHGDGFIGTVSHETIDKHQWPLQILSRGVLWCNIAEHDCESAYTVNLQTT